MSHTYTVKTTVTITTEEPFFSKYNAERRMNEIKESAGDYKILSSALIATQKKTKVEMNKKGAE
jgi:hypothetical protein